MKCPNCGFDNPEGVRFCGQCATEVNLACPSCGSMNPANFKFCGQCATPLRDQAIQEAPSAIPTSAIRDLADNILDPSRQQIEGERRNISVVFVDVRSFTPLSEQLDPEEVYAAVDVFLRALVEQVHLYGGHVDKFTGDGLMALFGAPQAHEDDPERAVRAAWGMQQALRRLAETSAWSAPIALNARIGVNTGTVVVGDVGADVNYTAMGDVVNVAARLEQNAEPGSVLVSDSTYELTLPFFEFKPIGPLQVKGRREPIESYQVIGEKAQPGSLRGTRGLRAPMIGRQAELARLQAIATQLVAGQRGGLVLVAGEAGVGKSRLTAELRATLPQEGVTFLTGETASHGRSSAYRIFRRILRRFFGFDADDSPATARRKIIARLESLDPELVELAQVYLENMIGLPLSEAATRQLQRLEPQQIRQQTFLAVRAVLTAAAAEQPLLIVLEDLHWVDELSLELLLFLLNSTAEAPLLLYGTTRSKEGVALRRLDEAARARLNGSYHRIDLQPLSPGDNSQLIQSLLDLSSLSPSIDALITEKAAGNPFFTEELIGVLIDKGVFQRENGRWRPRPEVDLTKVDVPLTLDGLIMARVDNMGPEARRVLQHASVIGRQFAVPLLQQLLNGEGAQLEYLLPRMEERGFVVLLSGESQPTFEFRHGLTRDSVYNSLLLRRRRELHGQAAGAIERLYPERMHDEPELLAYHFSLSDTPARALPYQIAAGHLARERFATKEAIDFYEQALALLDGTAEAAPGQLVEIDAGLGEVRALIGEYSAAVSAYQSALNILAESGEAVTAERVADIQRRLGRVFEAWGDYEKAMSWLETGLKTLDQAGASDAAVSRAMIYNDRGWVYYRQGNFEEAFRWMTQAVPMLEGTEHQGVLASAYNRLVALSYNYRGELEQALTYAEKGLQLRRKIGDTFGEARSYVSLGSIVAIGGQWDRAIRYWERGLGLCDKVGYSQGIVMINVNLAFLFQWKGDMGRADMHLRRALEVARAISNPWLIGLALYALGELAILQKKHKTALEYLAEARSVSREAGARDNLAEAEWRTAWAYLELRDLQAAELHVDEAISIAQETGAKEALGDALRIRGVLCRLDGRIDEARRALEESIQIFQKLSHKYKIALGQFELGRLYAIEALDYPDGAPALSARAAQVLSKAIDTFKALDARPELETAREALLGAPGPAAVRPAGVEV